MAGKALTGMASKALKKQMCYALGTLAGWGLAKLTKAKETVPFTILGGVAGFAVSENVFGADDTKLIKPYVAASTGADKKKDDELSGPRGYGPRGHGTRRKQKPAKKRK